MAISINYNSMLQAQPLAAIIRSQHHPVIAFRGQSLHRSQQRIIISTFKSTLPTSSAVFTSKRCRASYPHRFQAAGSSGESTSDRFQVEISTNEAQTALKFSAIRVGGGKAIVVAAVAAGSEAAEAGIQVGQQLFSLSDPIRPAETWALNDRSSLRYINDAVRMRRAPYILFELSTTPLKEWVEETQGSGFPSALNSYSSASDTDEPIIPPVDEPDLLSAVAAEALSSSSSLDSVDLPISAAPGSIGERLQRNYKKSNSGMTDLEKRQSKRKEYFAQTGKRNDTTFFLGVLAAFLLPAVIILGIASSSGYLDALESGWAGR